MNLIERLEGEHRAAVAALERMEDACVAAGDSPESDAEARALDGALDVIGGIVHAHATDEEDLVFPELRGQGMDALLDTLAQDHREVRSIHAATEAAARTWRQGGGPSSVWTVPARELRGRLAAHMQRENLMIFPRARRLAGSVLVAWEGR